MRAKLRFWIDPNNDMRWMRMTLIGEDWPVDWAVPYVNLDSWGMLTWFHLSPAESEGLRADQNYRMSDVPQAHEFAGLLNNLHQLISEVKPAVDPDSGLVIEDEREYA